MGGWIHKMSDDLPKYIAPLKVEPEVVIDAGAMWKEWSLSTTSDRLKTFAHKLGVETLALSFLGCVWAPPHHAWAFPMRDPHKRIVGIRLRSESGDKWAVKGSRVGCFYTSKLSINKVLYVLEGPTDTAAALTLGLTAIGRPSCLGCESQVNDYVRLNKIVEVVIVADNDAPGLRGAEKLQASLRVPSCLWIPPVKDLREFAASGGDAVMIQSMIKNLIWTQPTTTKQESSINMSKTTNAAEAGL